MKEHQKNKVNSDYTLEFKVEKTQSDKKSPESKVVTKNFYYKQQRSFSTITLLVCGIFGALALGCSFWIVVNVVEKKSWYEYILPILGLLSSLTVIIGNLRDYLAINGEAKKQFSSGENYFENNNNQKLVPGTLRKLYCSMHAKTTNLNWLAFSIYFYTALVMLFCHIFGLFSSNPAWWQWIGNLENNKWTLYIYIFSASLLGCTFCWHMFFWAWRSRKIAQIDNFYGYQVTPLNDIIALKTSKSKRNRWFFILSVIIVFIPFYLTYKIIRKLLRK